jgi:trehalose 6-phosphate phosphatase
LTLREAIEDLLRHRPVLVGVDFDGTLAPLVDHPSLAEPDATAIEILVRLAARPGMTVAVVSGRSLADLRERLGDVPGAIFIGEHGNDTGEPATPGPVLEEAIRLVADVVAATPGSIFETKPNSVSFYYRNVEPGNEVEVLERLRAFADARPDLSWLEGKTVVEISTGGMNKGAAMRELAGEEGRILYIGDDTTDETVFAQLGPADVGIKVGPGETKAEFRVDDVAGVVEVLEVIDLTSA